MTVTGTCLCGAIAYEVDPPFQRFVNCHCSRCRKASGSAYAANALVAPDAFSWPRGQENVTRFDLPNAASFSVCFCRTCGAQLPHATRSGKAVIIPAGTLDTDPGQSPTHDVHWNSRARWIEDGEALSKQD